MFSVGIGDMARSVQTHNHAAYLNALQTFMWRAVPRMQDGNLPPRTIMQSSKWFCKILHQCTLQVNFIIKFCLNNSYFDEQLIFSMAVIIGDANGNNSSCAPQVKIALLQKKQIIFLQELVVEGGKKVMEGLTFNCIENLLLKQC